MVIIKLKYPIICNDEQLTELDLPERIKLKNLKAMDAATGEIGKISALLASLTGLPVGTIDQLDAEDFAVIGEEMEGFLGSLPGIGKP